MLYWNLANHYLKPTHSVFWPRVHPPTHANEQPDLIERLVDHSSRFFVRRRGIVVYVDAMIGSAIFPSVVKCQQKQYRRAMPTCRRLVPQNWLPWQCPLTEVHQIFRLSNIFIGRVNATIHPLSNDKVTFKKKVTSAKHKPAGKARAG